jgi:hypothetical protein
MCPVRGGVGVVSVYVTMGKETSFPAACFHLKLKKLTIGLSKDLCLPALVKDIEELICSFNFNPFSPFECSGKSFITFPI